MIGLVNSAVPGSESGGKSAKGASEKGAGNGFDSLLGSELTPEEAATTGQALPLDGEGLTEEMLAELTAEELALLEEQAQEDPDLLNEEMMAAILGQLPPSLAQDLPKGELSAADLNALRQQLLKQASDLNNQEVVLEGADPRVDPQAEVERAVPGTEEQLFSNLVSEETADSELQPDVSAVIRQMALKRGKAEGESLDNLHEFRAQNQRIQDLINENVEADFQETDPTELAQLDLKPNLKPQMSSVAATGLETSLSSASNVQFAGVASQAMDDLASQETEVRSQQVQQHQAFGTNSVEGRTDQITQPQAPTRTPVLELPFDFNQVMTRIRTMRDGDSQEMTVQLEPEHLGKLVMKVRQQGGELFLDMKVDNPMAKQILESGFDVLRNRVTQQDLNYRDLSMNVNVGQQNSGGFEQQQERQEQLERMTAAASRGAERSAAINSSAPSAARTRGGGSGLNLYI